ncbi:SDR family NAD(P)-dependent oxidoreductase [Pseudoroseicyclus aestuarii]|uniref:NAD(P)-dependent dehydrogenase (Short-subunit alcohol dehydrogenase family) n=1 Tax=Pseudoroseicyclus aestuarii TaxID=1795041 RepID=A0A318SQ34_9RHOB|nr:SDR family oxidoreductase [Pseudoroseicyclus aestuarii]PYE83782.1 NAD(P)-dependent dehydrogenase (short-subunit alcohol dehydrogenase family) [Pseudoroseicyclus aestuarii]
MDLGIKGKRALITGGTGGMGLETAKLLKAEGATIVLSDMDQEALDKAAEELGGVEALIAADLTKPAEFDRLAERMKALGGTDILVHTTGITGAKGDPLEMKDEDWEEAWTIDFMSAVRLSRVLVPQMVDKGWGRCVFVTSENAVQPYPDEMVYNVAKAALLNFVKGVSMPYSAKGVLINAVSPAFIESPMTDGMMEKRAEKSGESKEETIQSFLKEERPFMKQGRRGKVEEVAPVIALLCSDLASFTVGSAYRVDGGSVGAMNI